MTPRPAKKKAPAVAKARPFPAARKRKMSAAGRDVQSLHDDWKTALAQHQVRVEAQFRTLQHALRPPAVADAEGVPTPKQLERIEAALEDAQLKPRKGRGKDLRNVERSLQRMLKALPDND